MLSKVKIGFIDLSIPVKIEFATKIRLAIEGNVNFSNPIPTMEQLSTAITALFNAARAASEGGISKTASLYLRETELKNIVSSIASYVQTASGGDEEKIRSSGFDVRKAASPSIIPEQVQQLIVTTSAYEGEVLLKWKSKKGVRIYYVEKSADGSTGWINCGLSTKSKVSIGGLTSMTIVWFRVIAMNTAGKSAPSVAVKGVVA